MITHDGVNRARRWVLLHRLVKLRQVIVRLVGGVKDRNRIENSYKIFV